MNEPLVWQPQLEAIGIVCDPFWAHSDPFEGDFYHEYIATHPDFSLAVRQTVASMLVTAQEKVPSNWQIVLRAGYRPLSVQQAIFDSFCAETARLHPEWSGQQIHTYAETYVSDPTSTSPHYTGGAVDIDVRNIDSDTYIDFGTPINTASSKSHLDTNEITAEQQSNREVLHSAMLSVGFAPLASEWWHFQYGERVWTDYYGHDSPMYDIIREI